jgi:hypothetical protein
MSRKGSQKGRGFSKNRHMLTGRIDAACIINRSPLFLLCATGALAVSMLFLTPSLVFWSCSAVSGLIFAILALNLWKRPSNWFAGVASILSMNICSDVTFYLAFGTTRTSSIGWLPLIQFLLIVFAIQSGFMSTFRSRVLNYVAPSP